MDQRPSGAVAGADATGRGHALPGAHAAGPSQHPNLVASARLAWAASALRAGQPGRPHSLPRRAEVDRMLRVRVQREGKESRP